MKRKYRKSFFGTTAIIVSIAIWLFVIVTVLAFFFYFKYQITLVIHEQYLWNKIQGVPMNLFSMDLDEESAVSKMNKVYYELDSGDELDKVKGNISKQIFYFVKPENMGFILAVEGITLSESPFPDCRCKKETEFGQPTYKCRGGCSVPDGTYCVKDWLPTPSGLQPIPDPSMCFDIGRIEYHGDYPFPLTFNGSGYFIGRLTYDVVEYK